MRLPSIAGSCLDDNWIRIRLYGQNHALHGRHVRCVPMVPDHTGMRPLMQKLGSLYERVSV
jgi:hypothetical protein